MEGSYLDVLHELAAARAALLDRLLHASIDISVIDKRSS